MGNIFVNCVEDYTKDDLQEVCIYCNIKSNHYDMKCNNCKAVFHKQCFSNKTNKCPVCNTINSIMIWEYILK